MFAKHSGIVKPGAEIEFYRKAITPLLIAESNGDRYEAPDPTWITDQGTCSYVAMWSSM